MSFTIHDTCFIKKVEFRQAGEKSIAEVSVCQKKYNKDKEAAAEFDWLRLTIWEPHPSQVEKLKKGNLIYFSGKFSTRKYTDKAGVEKTSMEVRCNDWNAFEMPGVEAAAPAPAPVPRRPTPVVDAGGSTDDSNPPFLPRGNWE
jgi:single-stranded DNA-binding protein